MASSSPPSPPGGQRRLLVVDDYDDVLDLLAMFFERSGFLVSTSRTGGEALRLASEATPDCVVLDLQLPDMTGLDVARQLRRSPATADVPIIAVTGRSLPEDLAEARAAGMDAILVKPCPPPDLLDEIERLLGARGSKRPAD